MPDEWHNGIIRKLGPKGSQLWNYVGFYNMLDDKNPRHRRYETKTDTCTHYNADPRNVRWLIHIHLGHWW